MSLVFGSPEWCAALHESINKSEDYAQSAKTWGVDFNGNLMFAIEADDTFSNPLNILLYLKAGHCDGVETVEDPGDPEAGFSIQAPFKVWTEIFKGNLKPATAIFTGKMRVRGSMTTMMKYANSAQHLIQATRTVPTAFP
jgi:putative sterol carrier protein